MYDYRISRTQKLRQTNHMEVKFLGNNTSKPITRTELPGIELKFLENEFLGN